MLMLHYKLIKLLITMVERIKESLILASFLDGVFYE